MRHHSMMIIENDVCAEAEKISNGEECCLILYFICKHINKLEHGIFGIVINQNRSNKSKLAIKHTVNSKKCFEAEIFKHLTSSRLWNRAHWWSCWAIKTTTNKQGNQTTARMKRRQPKWLHKPIFWPQWQVYAYWKLSGILKLPT